MIRPFIDKLGGPRAVAEKVAAMSGEALRPKTVTQWAYDGAIPHRWRPFLFRLAAQKRVSVPAAFKSIAKHYSPSREAQQ